MPRERRHVWRHGGSPPAWLPQPTGRSLSDQTSRRSGADMVAIGGPKVWLLKLLMVNFGIWDNQEPTIWGVSYQNGWSAKIKLLWFSSFLTCSVHALDTLHTVHIFSCITYVTRIHYIRYIHYIRLHTVHTLHFFDYSRLDYITYIACIHKDMHTVHEMT